MEKIIRQKLPTEYSIGILLLIFALTYFLSGRLFETPAAVLDQLPNMHLAMFLASIAVLLMILILWEELLFPIHINPKKGEVTFRNYRHKLKIQMFIYLVIPAIVGYLAINYELNLFSFIPWAAVCLFTPLVGKLVSGVHNYNDFLRLTDDEIAYKNNEKEGILKVSDIQFMTLTEDKDGFLSKLEISMADYSQIVIDLDEMELEDFYDSIQEYMSEHYQKLIIEGKK